MVAQEFKLSIEDEYHSLKIHISISHDFIQEHRKRTLEDPLAQEYNLDEDQALLFFDVCKSGKDDSDDEAILSKELLKMYRERNRRDPVAFPKVFVNGKALTEELGKLKSDGGLRYHILYTNVSEELERMKKEEEERLIKESESKLGFSLKRSSTSQRDLSEENVKQNEKLRDPFHRDAEQSPLVILTTVGRNFKPTSFKIREKYLSSASEYFKDELSSVSEENIEDEVATTAKKISLSEFDKQFKFFDLGDTFHPTNVERFMKYCENPDFMERFQNAKKKLEELTAENTNKLNRAIERLDGNKKKRIDEITSRIESEKIEFRRILNKCKEFDMERLRILYEVHLQNEFQKLDRLLDIRTQELNAFYQKEIQRTSQMYEKQQSERKLQTENELKDATELMESILPKEGLVTMLTLSDIVRSDDLRDTCVRILGRNFDEYYRDKHLGCQLITVQTLQQLLSQLNSEQLHFLADQFDYSFPRDLVLKEVEYRKGILVAEYKDYSVPELLEKLSAAEGTVFSELLSHEIAKRQKKKPFVSLSSTFVSPFLKVHEDGLTVELRGHKRYSCVHASHSRNFEGWGKWYFEVYIEEFDESYGSSISIGWDVPRDPSYMDGPIIGMTPGEKTMFGFGWQSDGIFHYGGGGVFIEEFFKQGDTIGCSLDQDKKMLMFFKNGHRITLLRRDQQ